MPLPPLAFAGDAAKRALQPDNDCMALNKNQPCWVYGEGQQEMELAMGVVKALLGLAGTAFIAATVAYAVSAPRTVDAAMDQEQAALGGKSINQHFAEAKAEMDLERCNAAKRLAQDAWDHSIERGTAERDAERLDDLDGQVARHCKP
jgi:hypothetical protein